MKAVVAAFNQEKALVEAFSVITNLRMEIFEALVDTGRPPQLLRADRQVNNYNHADNLLRPADTHSSNHFRTERRRGQ